MGRRNTLHIEIFLLFRTTTQLCRYDCHTKDFVKLVKTEDLCPYQNVLISDSLSESGFRGDHSLWLTDVDMKVYA